VAGHELITAHLAALARRLPADAVDELADGLVETWQQHLAAGLPPTRAAHAAVDEFGTVDQIVGAFVTHCPARRTARTLLATGPLAGVCWGATLASAHAWTWPVPTVAVAVGGAVLVAVVAALVASATSRTSYRRARLGTAGSLGLAALDATMLATVLILAPAPVWPMVAAVPVSLARIGLTLGVLRTAPARR
jgi:hypothetical protein